MPPRHFSVDLPGIGCYFKGRTDVTDLTDLTDTTDGGGLLDKLRFTHGGYRNLRSFQVAELIYDATVKFCDFYLRKAGRTHDQMVQAARSGVQNIAEGSQAAGTSKKTELKLTQVARASLEELLRDYEDFLRQRELPVWESDDSRRVLVRELRPQSIVQLHEMLASAELWGGVSAPERCANVMTALICQANYLLDRQIGRLEKDFLENGGFTERLYRMRKENRGPVR